MATLNEKLNKFAFVTVFNPTFYEKDDTSQSKPLFQLDSLSISNFTQEGPNKTAKGGLYANTLLRYGKTMRLEMEDVIGRLEALEAFMGVESREVTGAQVKTFTVTEAQTDFDLNDSGATVTLVEVNSEDVASGEFTTATGVVSLNTAATEGDIVSIHYTATGTTDKIVVTDKFSSLKAIVGETFVVDQNGNKKWINVVIPKFLPDSIFEQTMEAEGDFGVFSIAGDIQADENGDFYYFEDNTDHDA